MSNGYPTFRYYYSGGTGSSDAVGDGQLLIGQTGGIPVMGTITAGPGITVDNGPGTVTVSATVNSEVLDSYSLVEDVVVSLTDVPVNSMIVSPSAGAFIVFFSGTYLTDTDAAVVSLSIYLDGVKVPQSEIVKQETKNEKHWIGTMAYIPVVLSGQAIDVRCRVTIGSATFYGRQIIAQRMAA